MAVQQWDGYSAQLMNLKPKTTYYWSVRPAVTNPLGFPVWGPVSECRFLRGSVVDEVSPLTPQARG